ncbi:MAG: A24 family peptidase [Desulfobacterales bacterium]|nr:A24 family peptidase [Desulfobacterales bacterium]
MPLDHIVNLFVFFAGTCIGSFLNVCIYRIPAGLSVAFPPSSCPRCEQPIRFYDNIPVLSYIFLRGRCRSCAAPIAIRYPLVEMLTGLAAWCVYVKHGPSAATLIYIVFVAVLIVITFIDIDHQIIPDVLSLPGIPLFLAAGLWATPITWPEALIGIAAGGGSLLLVAMIYRQLTGKDGMGMGDVKLLAMIGALIGWRGVCFTIFFSSVVGSLVGLLLMIRAGGSLKTRLAFGPFLAMGAVAYIFYGPELINAYLGLTTASH